MSFFDLILSLLVICTELSFAYSSFTTENHPSTPITVRPRSLPTAANFTGISQPPAAGTSVLAQAYNCWSIWDAWSRSSSSCPVTTYSTSRATRSDTITSIIYETYKLCDGHPRANVSGGEWVSSSTGEMMGSLTTWTLTEPPTGIATATTTVFYETTYVEYQTSCISLIPTPTCSINAGDACNALFNAFDKPNNTRLRPPCTYSAASNPCDDCMLYIPSVKLMYFPVTMTGDFCGSYSTVQPPRAANSSTPSTVEISGTIYTSGYAYLSYAGISAGDGSRICGTTKGPGVLALPTSEVFSYRGHVPAMPAVGDVHYPFNFADLAPNPVPWDAWISQETCYTNQKSPQCQTITQEAYRPGIVYPRAFWSMDPEWSKCASDIVGIVDPPTALPNAVAAVIATMTAPKVSYSARPADGPAKTPPRQTAGPSSSGSTVSATIAQPQVSLASVITTTGIVPSSALLNSIADPGTLSIIVAPPPGSVISGSGTSTLGQTVQPEGGSRTVIASFITDGTSPLSTPGNALSVLVGALTSTSDPVVEMTLGGEAITAYSGGIVVAGHGTTVAPEGATQTIQGHTILLGSAGVVIDSSTAPYTYSNTGTKSLSVPIQTDPAGGPIVGSSILSQPAAATMTIGAQLFTIASARGGSMVNGYSVSQGAVLALGAATISGGSLGIAIINGITTSTIPYSAVQTVAAQVTAPASEAVLTVDSLTVTASEYVDSSGNAAFVLESSTYGNGIAAAIMSGITISAGAGALVAVEGGSTLTASFTAVQSQVTLPAVQTVPASGIASSTSRLAASQSSATSAGSLKSNAPKTCPFGAIAVVGMIAMLLLLTT